MDAVSTHSTVKYLLGNYINTINGPYPNTLKQAEYILTRMKNVGIVNDNEIEIFLKIEYPKEIK